jgi:hypothetical protein
MFLELGLQHRRHSSARRPRSPRVQACLVPVQPPLAGCYLCQEVHRLVPYEIMGQRVGICKHCHYALARRSFSERCLF